MSKKIKYPPLIYSYLQRYQDDPTSRVFAPLAEAYRKAGLVEEAIEIAKEGLKIHPRFSGGRVALARALFDKKLYEEVLEELTPIMPDIPDNLVAQRLVAESSLMVGRVADALNAYKMLLYFSPQDEETARIVQELEAQAYEKGVLVLKSEPAPEFSISAAQSAILGDPDRLRAERVRKIEILQGILQKVERYRTLAEVHLNN